MEFNNLVLDPVKASKIMEDFEKTQKTPSIMKNNFSKKEKFLLFSVCYLRTSGNLLLSKKLTVDLINMLCIMKKYKKGGSPYEIEEYDPPRGSFLSGIGKLALGGIGAAFCLMGIANAVDQTITNTTMLKDEVDSIGELMDFAQNDWDKRSNLITEDLVNSFRDAIKHNPGIEDRILDDEDDFQSDQVALPEGEIDTSYLAIGTWENTMSPVLLQENTLATCLTMAVASTVGDVIPNSFSPDIKNIEAATTVLQNELMSAFNSLQEAAKNSQPASLMKKITKSQALIMTDVKTTGKNWFLSSDTSHLKNSLEQLRDLQGNIITEYGQASLQTFSATKRKTSSKIKNIRANIESINNNLWAIKTHLAGFLVALKIIKSGLRRTDDDLPEITDFEYYNIGPRREITLGDSRGRSEKKKKPVTHKKPKGKKSKGKRGKPKGKKSKGKRGKTRRK
jgi:hypothetical protein